MKHVDHQYAKAQSWRIRKLIFLLMRRHGYAASAGIAERLIGYLVKYNRILRGV